MKENLALAHGINGVKLSLPEPTCYKPDCTSPANQKEFQAIVGSPLYIAWTTRPEISIHHDVNLLGRRAIAPSTTNLVIAKDSGLEGKIEIYVDASYGGEEARSQTGVIAMVANQPVMWYSRRQDTVSLSITEAEYIT
jgi:hypothetical protein